MPVATKRELAERLRVLRANDPHYFSKRYRTADQIARLAGRNGDWPGWGP